MSDFDDLKSARSSNSEEQDPLADADIDAMEVDGAGKQDEKDKAK